MARSSGISASVAGFISAEQGETESLPEEYPQSDEEMVDCGDWIEGLGTVVTIVAEWQVAEGSMGSSRGWLVVWAGLGWGTMTVRGCEMASLAFLASRAFKLSPRWCIREPPNWWI